MIVLLDYKNLVVHINTQDEGHEVAEWFKGFGIRVDGLVPSAYMLYPYFGVIGGERDERLIGAVYRDYSGYNGYRKMEYAEWKSIIEDEADRAEQCVADISEESFSMILGF